MTDELAADGAHDKGLARNAIGLLSGVAIGVAATTPAAGVALVLGLLALGTGVHMPATIVLGFVPILLVASAYHHLNRVEPDCGTTFAWATRSFGPWLGWFGGWIVVATLAVVVTNFAQLLGAYSLLLVGADGAADSTAAVTVLGTVWFAALALVAYRGIELSKRVQVPMLVFELSVLTAFGAVATVRGVVERPLGSVVPSLSWLDPTALSTAALAAGFVAAVLLFWGWDTTVMVNEESEDPALNPGRAAIASTAVLLGLYLLCAVGVLAWAGPERLGQQPGNLLDTLGPEVFAAPFDKLLVLAVLSSAVAGGILLPIGGARTLLSMAAQGAVPPALGRIHPRFRTPATATLAFSAIGLVYYVAMTLASESVLVDSLTALGLLVAFYYALTGFACVVYFRRRLRSSVRDLVLLGLAPLTGALLLSFVLVKNAIDLADPAASASATEWLGVGAPLAIALTIAAIGVVAMLVSRVRSPEFFRRRAEAAPAALAARQTGAGELA